jgi:hypothetical protein
MRHLIVWIIAAVAGLPTALAGEPMTVAQQNSVVRKYCAVCHTDIARNGGLSLEHFDAAQVAPSLAAMMISKITGGVSLDTARAAASDRGAAALVAFRMKSGAMGAAGIPVPDKPTIDGLVASLAAEASGAHKWNVHRGPAITASILRELPGANHAESAMFRLVVTCNSSTREGDMQLAWAPLPKTGSLSATFDRETTLTYNVEGRERMGNGSPAITGPAAVSLYRSGKMTLPLRMLTIQSDFQTAALEFPFSELPGEARQALAACFGKSQGGE